jgi:hypothetical protein
MVRQCSGLQLRYRESSPATHSHRIQAAGHATDTQMPQVASALHYYPRCKRKYRTAALTLANVGFVPHPNTGAWVPSDEGSLSVWSNPSAWSTLEDSSAGTDSPFSDRLELWGKVKVVWRGRKGRDGWG